ncbi:MAG: hypothetical protein KF784_15935 [Fimbriimonadaceae bacterium]|nr:hypothetical protein [Fimbriimonadaceae bacterium]
MASKRYPPELEICGNRYLFDKVLKEDFFSVNVLYRDDAGLGMVLKCTDFRFLLGFCFKPLACMLSRHEWKMYSLLQGVPGIPRLGPRIGWNGLCHEFIEGHTLYEHKRGDILPDEFFDRLLDLMRALHSRSIIHLDSNKRGNIIVGDDGLPYIIDFQISLCFGKLNGPFRAWKRGLFGALVREDIYHIYKRKQHLAAHLMSDEELALSVRSAANARMKRWVGDPYRKVKRLIYPRGSNETIWYKHKRLKKGEIQDTD